MTDSSDAQVYVAELYVSSYFHPSSEVRSKIPNAPAYELRRGYWLLRPLENPADTEAPAEVVFVIEFVRTTLKEAEEYALKIGRLFSAIVSAYAGYPLGSPLLRRIGSTDVEGRLMSQHIYWYESKTHMLSKFGPQIEYQLQKYINLIASIDAQTRHKLQLAIHWYGLSVTSDDPIIGYVAAWNGIESIGGTLDSKFHPYGPKAPCRICKNVAGNKRKRSLAGVEHIFQYIKWDFMPESIPVESRKLVSSELVEGFS